MRGWKNLHGSTSTTRRCGVNFEGFGRQGRLDTGRRVQTPPAKGTVQRGKRQGRVSATITRQEGLAQIEAASAAALVTMPTTTWGTVLKEGARLSKQAEQNLNTLLNGSTELDDVARALDMLDVESQEGIIKAAVKPVGTLLHGSRKTQRKSAV